MAVYGNVLTQERYDALYTNRTNRLFCFTHSKNGAGLINDVPVIKMWIDAMKTSSPHKIIVLVDNTTTDNTAQIALSEGCDVFSFKWKHNFALAKNTCIEVAKRLLNESDRLHTGDWCLFAGDDMILGAGEAIRTFINEDGNFCGSFWIPESIGTHRRIRFLLFRYHDDIVWERDVHEEVFSSCHRLWRIGLVVVPGNFPPVIGGPRAFVHYGHELDRPYAESKIDYYRNLYQSYKSRRLWNMDRTILGHVYEKLLASVPSSDIIDFINQEMRQLPFEEYEDLLVASEVSRL